VLPKLELVLNPYPDITAHSSEADWEEEDFTLDQHHLFGRKRLHVVCRLIGFPQVMGPVLTESFQEIIDTLTITYPSTTLGLAITII
jgi:hypothetical protein